MAIASIDDDSHSPRLAAVDLARGIAIGAMVIYHTAFDLSANRLVGVDVIDDLGWKIFARSIAGTFLLLVGVSLVLATRGGFRRNAFLRRLALVAGAAVLVSLGTWWFDPTTFVFFGILHEIAVASVLGLLFLRPPSWLIAIVASAIIAAPWFLASPVFNAPALWWVGLSTEPPVTVDYVPIFPWFGVVLAGILVGRLLVGFGGNLWRWRPDNVLAKNVIAAGRWSLLIYLVHQPLIVGLVYVYMAVVPKSEAVARQNFMGQCVAVCRADQRDEETCASLCGCMFANLYGTDLFELKSVDSMNAEQSARWNGILERCIEPTPPAATGEAAPMTPIPSPAN